MIVVVGMEVEQESAETGIVAVLLATIEKDVELETLHETAESGGLRLGDQAIDIARNDSQKRDIEGGTDRIRKESLEIGVGGVVLSLGVERREKITIVVVAETDAVGKTRAEGAFGKSRAAQERGRELGTENRGAAIGDVESRREPVTIGSIETTWREENMVDHVGIDDAKAFLLATTNQHGAIDLYVVDIDKILVERAATDRILRRHLIVGIDVGERLEQTFDAVVGADSILEFLYVDMRERSLSATIVDHANLLERGSRGAEPAILLERLSMAREKGELDRFEASERETQANRVEEKLLGDLEPIPTLEIGGSADGGRSVENAHIDKLESLAVGACHTALDPGLGEGRKRRKKR